MLPPRARFPLPRSSRRGRGARSRPDLVQLVDPAARLPGQTREAITRGLSSQEAYRGAPGSRGAGGEAVYVYVQLLSGTSTGVVDAYTVRVMNRDERNAIVAAWVAPDRLLTLASQSSVRSIRTVDPPGELGIECDRG